MTQRKILIAIVFISSFFLAHTSTREFPPRYSSPMSGRFFVTQNSTRAPKYFFKNDKTIFYDLEFAHPAAPPPNIPSGTSGVITAGIINEKKIIINNYTIPDQSTPTHSEKPIKISSISFITQFCQYPPVTRAEVQESFAALQTYIPSCTKNKYIIPPEENIILGTIELSCTYNPCDYNNLYSMVTALEKYATSVNIPITSYRHRLVFLPKILNCNWSGLGNIGCSPFCYAWFSGNYVSNYEVILHELGHNLGLEHASTTLGEYDDQSCVMGYCCNKICFNAPHEWKLGIAQSRYSLAPNIWSSIILTPGEFVKVDPNPWVSYFVSYRSDTQHDINLPNLYKNKVLIYMMSTGSSKSVLLAVVDEQQSYTTTDVSVIFNSHVYRQQANINMCFNRCIQALP